MESVDRAQPDLQQTPTPHRLLLTPHEGGEPHGRVPPTKDRPA